MKVIKSWVITIEEVIDDEGKHKVNMLRVNDGFTLFEMIGINEKIRVDLLDFFNENGAPTVDSIKRTVVGDPHMESAGRADEGGQ